MKVTYIHGLGFMSIVCYPNSHEDQLLQYLYMDLLKYVSIPLSKFDKSRTVQIITPKTNHHSGAALPKVQGGCGLSLLLRQVS